MPADLEPYRPRGDLVPPAYEREAIIREVHPLRFAWRNRHATGPLAAPPAMFAAGEILHAIHHPLDVLVVCGSVAVVTWFKAPHKWSAEPRWHGWQWTSEVIYSRATAIGAGGWLVLAAYAGVHGPQETTLAVLGAAWGVPFWLHKRPRGKRKRRRHERRVARWNAWWQSHAAAWGAAGSGVVDVKDHGAMESLLVQLRGGRQSVATVRNIAPLLESALGGYVHHGMTRIEIVKSNPSQVWVHLKREDPLREVIPWDDSMCPDDITREGPLGLRETGTWLTTCLRSGFFILGRTRRGKSNELSVMLATATKCRNARVLLIDMKGGRSARPWLPSVDWLATTIEEARLILAFALAEVKARGAYAYNGEEQLTPTDEVPTLFIVIDETYGVTSEYAGDTRCAAMLAEISGAGQGVEVYPWVTSQYGALDTTVRTEQTRSNLNKRMCFQTEHHEHGAFALGEDARRGVDATNLAEKGQFYFRADSETSPEQIRGPHLAHAAATELAIRNAELTELHSRPLRAYCGAQPISAEQGALTWQQVYDSRWSRLPASFRRDAPQVQATPPQETATGANKINFRPVHPDAALINADIDESPDVSDEDIRRARDLRAERGEAIDFGSEHDRRRARFASLLESASERGITPAQLKAASGLGRTWIHENLAALCAGGAARKIADGRYVALTGDVAGALAVIHGEADDLAAAARQMAGSDHGA
jgi:hypothetical protein